MRIDTQCVHAGTLRDHESLGVNTPLVCSTSFLYPNDQNLVRYPRYFNIPTQEAPAKKIAALEGGEDGMVFSSGMAAISTTLLSFLKPKDHAVFQASLYGGTQYLIANQLRRLGIEITLVDSADVEEFSCAVRSDTKLIYFETPTNPLLKVMDLEGLAQVGRNQGVLTIIDNTFATPINQRPLSHGIDVVVHSGTKYLNGHSDLCCGAVVTSSALMKTIRTTAVDLGPTLDPHACFMLERGLKTLALRVFRQNANAATIAQCLQSHPKIRAVHYPGLPQHPRHEVARKQMDGFGGMLSFEIDCKPHRVQHFLQALEVVTAAVSLGGVETLLTLPAHTSHQHLSPSERQAQGITDALIRLSVGIEDHEDLIHDLSRALENV